MEKTTGTKRLFKIVRLEERITPSACCGWGGSKKGSHKGSNKCGSHKGSHKGSNKCGSHKGSHKGSHCSPCQPVTKCSPC